MPDPADYYREIYARGLGGETPAIPVAVAELEQQAKAAMDPKAANYVWAGAGTEDTIDANAEAFRRRRIVPRMLRDVAERDLSTTLLGTAMPAPLLLAPIGVQKVVHDEGELATARAAAAVGVPMIASTASHFALEEIAEAGDGPRWFQLYWPNDDELAASLVRRAEATGYSALVLTVDNYLPGWKPRDLQQAYLPFLEGIGIAQYLSDPVFQEGLEKSPEEDMGAAVGHFLGEAAVLVADDQARMARIGAHAAAEAEGRIVDARIGVGDGPARGQQHLGDRAERVAHTADRRRQLHGGCSIPHGVPENRSKGRRSPRIARARDRRARPRAYYLDRLV